MDENSIGRLERLDRLRHSGALSDQEFHAQKQRILGERDVPRVGTKISSRWAVAAIVTMLLGVAAVWWVQSRRGEPPLPQGATASQAVPPAPAEAAIAPKRSEVSRLADAFEAATGHSGKYSVSEDGNEVTIEPLRIVQLPFGPALLTKRSIKDGCHACAGAIGVYYLRETGAATTVVGRWPKAVEGWGWGAPPTDWTLTTKFTAFPAIFASGGFMGQGVVEESSTLTELRPNGPVTSALIGTGFSDEGAIVENERPACVVKGKIENIRRDRSFSVRISGSISGQDLYLKKGDRFVAARKIDWGMPCDAA